MTMTRQEFLRRVSGLALPLPAFGLGALSAIGAETGRAVGPVAGGFNVRRFGARGDGRTKDTRALQAAIEAAGKGGGTVYFPPGRYLAGTLRLCSHVSIHLDAGAVLVASHDPGDFDPYEKLSYQSYADEETTDFHSAQVRGQDVEHVSILGQGTIDGNRRKRGGPKPIALKNCRHIAVRDITLQHSPNYNISLLGCDHVDISGVSILNGYCDGIDPDCSRFVRIANCYVESWDDAIVPKASYALGYRRSTENVTVTNCVLTTGCNALKLGTEASGDFKNIAFSNCTIFARPDLWKRGPTSGVSLEMVDGGVIDRVVVENLAMVDVRAPIFIRLGNRGRAQNPPQPGRLENVSIANITATGAVWASSITGIPGHPVRRVTLRGVRCTAQGGGAAALAAAAVPEQEDGYPDAGRFRDLPAYGLYCRHVEGLTLDDVKLHAERPDGRPALVIEDGGDVDLRGLHGDPPEGAEAVFALRDVRACLVSGSRAPTGTRTFIQLRGPRTARVRAVGNDLTAAATPFTLADDVPKDALRQEANLGPAR